MKVLDEKFVELNYDDLELDEKDIDELMGVGLTLIKKDRKTLVEYAVNHILSEVVDKLEVENDVEYNPEEKVDLLKKYIKIKI